MPDPTAAAARGKAIPRASLHTVEADGVRVFIAKQVLQMRRYCCSCTDTPRRRTCFAN
jgi:hypothetical protein